MGYLFNAAQKYNAIKFYTDHAYGPIYETLFPDPHSVKTVVEIGIDQGNSARTWLEYFINAHVYGVDVNETSKDVLYDIRFHPIIMSQNDPRLWSRIPDEVDLIIDDGSHLPEDQRETFYNGFHKVKAGGFWVIEDCHTSFWPDYTPGGLGIFGEVQSRIMELQTFGSGYGDFYKAREQMGAFMSPIGKMVYGVQVYKSLVVFEKAEEVIS